MSSKAFKAATSQRRSPPSTIASTIARSRHRRSAPNKAFTSPGSSTFGNVRGVRTSGRALRRPRRRVDNPRGTGVALTAPMIVNQPKNPDTVATRRLIVRADRPASPSARRTTLPSPRGRRWMAMNSSTSPAVTSTDGLSTTEKNTLRSERVAGTVFGRQRGATNRR
jgi:hypothetical protein